MPRLRAKRESTQTNGVSEIWKSQPETVRRFIEQYPDYEQLCTEVAYILGKRLETKNIEVAAITHRAKTLNSFLEKIQRKKYGDPFIEMEDYAGVRVVCLYTSDLPKVEGVIQEEFTVTDKVDKFRDKEPDQFGYGAIHYIVSLGRNSSGARYDDLRHLKCEIQARTVLQDAWAIIDHHLIYKRESDIPKPIQRKLNGLAGLFETADDQFDKIREERAQYLDGLAKAVRDQPRFLATEINKDSFLAYLNWRFPGMKPEGFDGQMSMVFSDIKRTKYQTLKSLDDAILDLLSSAGTIADLVKINEEVDSASLRLEILLAVADPVFRKTSHIPDDWRDKITQVTAKLRDGTKHRTKASSVRAEARR